MTKKEEQELELAINEVLAQQWTVLAKSAESRGDTQKTLCRVLQANRYAKLATDIRAEINNWK
jgi:hypothetical protein|tara:strand:- start:1101 stop:1289 length:189 start_codon:yes stop_codon:yes gene_type:complete